MILKATPEQVGEKAASISKMTYRRLVEEHNLRVHAYGAEFDTFGKFGSMGAWLCDALAESFGVVISEVSGVPVWSTDKCTVCHEVFGVKPSLAPNSAIHSKCAWDRAEALTHDDSKECGV